MSAARPEPRVDPVEHFLREELRQLYGEGAASAFDRAREQGLPCELCGGPAATLLYPEGVALCEGCSEKEPPHRNDCVCRDCNEPE